MRRVIKEFNIPGAGQASIFAIPPGTQGIQYNGKTYLDYLTEDTAPIDALYVGEMQVDGSVKDLIGAGLQDEFPHVFAGWDRKTPPSEKPVICLPAHKAHIMLHKIGILQTCENICKSLGTEAEIAFNKAPELRSNNPLVKAVLGSGGLGYTDDQIYKLFVDASKLI